MNPSKYAVFSDLKQCPRCGNLLDPLEACSCSEKKKFALGDLLKIATPLDPRIEVVLVVNQRGSDEAFLIDYAAWERGSFALRLSGDPQLLSPQP